MATRRKVTRRPSRRRNSAFAGRAHKDLEFHVDLPNGETKVFKGGAKGFSEAAHLAVAVAASNGSPVTIDVVTWSKAGARAYGGDYAVEVYNEDPEASVHDRIVVRAESRGRVA